MANSLTVTIHIHESAPNQNSVSYSDPSKQVMTGDEVVFRVDGTTGLVQVDFDNGVSPFQKSSLQLGGATLAAQQLPETVTVTVLSNTDFSFKAYPTSGSSKDRRGGQPDQPGTASGDIEVVPERGGGKDDERR